MKSPRIFHVLVARADDKELQPLFLDLSEQDLRLKFANPFKDGKDIFESGRITRIVELSEVRILEGNETAAGALKRLAQEHREHLEQIKRDTGTNVLGSSRGRSPAELVQACRDLTNVWLGAGPGSGSELGKISKFLHNPWVVNLGAAGVLLLVGYILGRMHGAT